MCIFLTWSPTFHLVSDLQVLSLRKGKSYFGRLMAVLLFLLVLVPLWKDSRESSSSSSSVGNVRLDLELERLCLLDLTASGTGFWVTNRLSPESLPRHNNTFRTKTSCWDAEEAASFLCHQSLTRLIQGGPHSVRSVSQKTQDTAKFSPHNQEEIFPAQDGTNPLREPLQWDLSAAVMFAAYSFWSSRIFCRRQRLTS